MSELHQNPGLLSPLALAFVGDAVYSLLTREKLAAQGVHASRLHGLSVRLVSAPAQAAAAERIAPLLSEEEMSVYKRGRNAHSSTTPKNATSREYHAATGLEALFGYLHLKGNVERIGQLFAVIWEAGFGKNSSERAGRT